jgi:DNA-binding response OmpR family regulator
MTRDESALVLIVEADAGLSRALERGLLHAGYRVQAVGTGSAALAAGPADVVLLDPDLPDCDGVDLCRHFSQSPETALIGLGARRTTADRTAMLSAGAHECVLKPFGLAELLARTRAARRRVRAPAQPTCPAGTLHLDPIAETATVSGLDVRCTTIEFAVLECLAVEPGRIVSRMELMERVWAANWCAPAGILDVLAASLRRKLAHPVTVQRVATGGFRLVAADPLPCPGA